MWSHILRPKNFFPQNRAVYLLLLLLLLTTTEFSLGSSSPYTITDKTNKNKYT
jgi:hypothetical protein